MEKKNINTPWHWQEKEDIYDVVNEWGTYKFACLMKDNMLWMFHGFLDETYDGHINVHIEAVDDKYDVDDIVLWIELP